MMATVEHRKRKGRKDGAQRGPLKPDGGSNDTHLFHHSRRRTLISTLTALMMAAVLPQAALAATSDDGLWRVDPKIELQLRLRHADHRTGRSANPAAGSFIVVSNGNVYLVTRATAYDSKGVQQVDYGRMTKEGRPY